MPDRDLEQLIAELEDPRVDTDGLPYELVLHSRGCRRLAAEELEIARRFGAPRALGIALRADALVAADGSSESLLTEAVAVLDGSGARLELARALVDLGAVVRRDGRRARAPELLRRGLELAVRCGAERLAARGREELLATGARPRRIALTGAESLTPSERRVAQLAAEGQTNRVIAQALFVTEKTVEGHLARAFDKLGVRSRTRLRDALGEPSPVARPAPGAAAIASRP